MVFYTQRVMGA